VRIIGFSASVETVEDLHLDKLDTMRGLDEDGNNMDKAQASGHVHIKWLYGTQLKRIQRDYPSITVTYDNMVDVSVTAALIHEAMAGTYKNDRIYSVYNYKLNRMMFNKIGELYKLDFGRVDTIYDNAFSWDASLTAVILRNNGVCALKNKNAFDGVGDSYGGYYVYVPAALKDQYMNATNWSSIANRIRAIEDYPDICGGA
jgi:hypothetical protein